jgi:hypothetical protein
VERLRSEDNFDDYSMRELAPDFGDSFAALSALMTSKDAKVQTGQTVPTLSPSSSGPKRPRPVSLSGLPPKRPKEGRDADVPEEPTTPDQPTRPSDPKLTKDTSSTSDSQGEANTKKLLDEFLCETLAALKREFAYINWQKSGHKMHLYQTYI